VKPTFILLFLLLSTASRSQIINGGFEEWVNNTPVGWYGEGKDTDAHSGSFCFLWYRLCGGEPGDITIIANYNEGKERGLQIPIGKNIFAYWYKLSIVGITNPWGEYVYYDFIYLHNGGAGHASSFPMMPTTTWTRATMDGTFYIVDSTVKDSLMIRFAAKYQPEKKDVVQFTFALDDVSFEEVLSADKLVGLAGKSFTISPNPISSHAHLNLHLENPASIHAAIYDITGRKVLDLPSLESASGDESIPFDVDEIPNGMYYLRCDIGGNTSVEKVIVCH
jgi:hypothetical protein